MTDYDGYRFNVEIERQDSEYDLTLARPGRGRVV
jgi:hypothetical protein